MTPKTAAIVTAGALALAVAGCGGSSSSSSSSSSGKSTSSKPGAVVMKNIAFAPTTATARVGEKVTWTNQDTVDHNVTATSGAKFHSQAFGKGKTYSYTPRKAGRISYVCTLHPQMRATLVVTR